MKNKIANFRQSPDSKVCQSQLYLKEQMGIMQAVPWDVTHELKLVKKIFFTP